MFHVEHTRLPYTVLRALKRGSTLNRHIRPFLLILALFGSSASAFALPGELNAVELRCGAPGAESKEISPVTNQLERTLIYNKNLYLHFEAVAGGWSFTTAWNNHLPMTRNELEKRMPCFRDAIQDAAKAAPAATNIDPTIAGQTVQSPENDATFGIPHFGLMVALVITLIVFLILPSARQRQLQRQKAKPVEHIYRKPNLDEYIPPTPPQPPIRRDLD
jgi:hypothetical protein